jgi:succinyl-CoA synthetase beta subunit
LKIEWIDLTSAHFSCVQTVVKSQILGGGRGLGTFKNSPNGGVHIVKAKEVEEKAGAGTCGGEVNSLVHKQFKIISTYKEGKTAEEIT